MLLSHTSQSATEYGSNWAKAWHNWALFHCGILESLVKAGEAESAEQYVAPAVTGFFRSVALGQAAGDRTGNLQDILRLLTLWFNYGSAPDVEQALQEGFGLVSIDTWLVVIPQVIARIHTNNPQVRPGPGVFQWFACEECSVAWHNDFEHLGGQCEFYVMSCIPLCVYLTCRLLVLCPSMLCVVSSSSG